MGHKPIFLSSARLFLLDMDNTICNEILALIHLLASAWLMVSIVVMFMLWNDYCTQLLSLWATVSVASFNARMCVYCVCVYFAVDSAKVLDALLSAVKADDSPLRCGKCCLHICSWLVMITAAANLARLLCYALKLARRSPLSSINIF